MPLRRAANTASVRRLAPQPMEQAVEPWIGQDHEGPPDALPGGEGHRAGQPVGGLDAVPARVRHRTSIPTTIAPAA